MPQVLLAALAIFLQCLAILTMGRMVRTVAEFKKTQSAYKEWYREHYAELEIEGGKEPKTGVSSGIEMTPMDKEEDLNQGSSQGPGSEDDINPDIVLTSPPSREVESQPTPSPPSFNPYHTPSSILKVDHGYVAASGGSLDNLDSPIDQFNKGLTKLKGGGHTVKREASLKKDATPPSISFKTDVQVHYYDQDAEIMNVNDPDKLD